MLFFFPASRRAEFPSRNLYGRVSRIDYLSESRRRRVSVEFDSIDADVVSRSERELKTYFVGTQRKPFALLRIITTEKRFVETAGMMPALGNWFYLKVEPRSPHGLPTWHCQLEAQGYLDHSRGKTSELYSSEEGRLVREKSW